MRWKWEIENENRFKEKVEKSLIHFSYLRRENELTNHSKEKNTKFDENDVDIKMSNDALWSKNKQFKKKFVKMMQKIKRFFEKKAYQINFFSFENKTIDIFRLIFKMSIIKEIRRTFKHYKNLEKKSSSEFLWKENKLNQSFVVSNDLLDYLSFWWNKIEYDEFEIATIIEIEHKMRNSTKNETRYQKLKQVYQISQSFVVFVDLFFYKKKKTFDHVQMRFLISRKSIVYRKEILIKNFTTFLEWVKNFFMFINSLIATKKNKTKIMLLMKTWKNIFVKNIKNMLVIDLIEHRILIYRIVISKIAKSMLYIVEKIT